MPTIRDLNQLSVFVRVAERRSFTKAAQDLRTTPSVVSRGMSDLEQALGFTLMNRSTHGVALTEAGDALLRSCAQIMTILDDYIVEMRNQQTGPYGVLRVQSISSYAEHVISPLISSFARRYPHLRVDIVTTDRHALEDGCDIILSDRKPDTPGLVERRIGIIRHVLCAAPDYLRRHGTPRQPQDLRTHNCLVDSEAHAREWPFRLKGQDLYVPIKGSASSNNASILMQLAVDGVGIARLPHYTARGPLADGTLVAVLAEETRSVEAVCAYFSRTKHLPAKISDFVDFLTSQAADDVAA
jgi:DNA-binding transcriptional LysR family regulator